MLSAAVSDSGFVPDPDSVSVQQKDADLESTPDTLVSVNHDLVALFTLAAEGGQDVTYPNLEEVWVRWSCSDCSWSIRLNKKWFPLVPTDSATWWWTDSLLAVVPTRDVEIFLQDVSSDDE